MRRRSRQTHNVWAAHTDAINPVVVGGHVPGTALSTARAQMHIPGRATPENQTYSELSQPFVHDTQRTCLCFRINIANWVHSIPEPQIQGVRASVQVIPLSEHSFVSKNRPNLTKC